MNMAKPLTGMALLVSAGLLIRGRLRARRQPTATETRAVATLVKFFYRPLIKRAAHSIIVGRNRSRHDPRKGRFTRAEIDRYLEEAWRRYDQLAASVPREPKIGNRMNMMLSCLTIAMFRVMLAAGIERGYTVELCADTAWAIYEKWAVVPGLVARLVTRNRVERFLTPIDWFLRFPFTSPGYQFKRQRTDAGVTITMVRCPVAEYFQAQDAADLCMGSWCNLDYGLAELWGGQLERTKTLAGGGDCCNFHFKAFQPASDSTIIPLVVRP